MHRYILLLIIAVVGAAGCAAQTKIDKLINTLEKKSDVETTYTERRSPKKKKLYRISTILVFSNQSYYNQLTKAFEEERDNTVSAVKTRLSMTYRFEDDKGMSSYTLSTTNGNAPYTLVMSWTSSDASKLESYNALDSDDSNLSFLNTGDIDFSVYTLELRNEIDESAKSNAEALRADACKKAAKARKLAAESRKKEAKARQEAAKSRKKAAEKRKKTINYSTDKDCQVIYCSNGLTIYQE